MKENIILNKDSQLNNIIQKIEHTNKSVEVYRGKKVVAKIVPVLKSELEQASQYKTWGETLFSSNNLSN